MKVEKALIELNEVRNDLIIKNKEDSAAELHAYTDQKVRSPTPRGTMLGAAATATSFKSV